MRYTSSNWRDSNRIETAVLLQLQIHMDNLQILTEDGQLRPEQPTKEDPNESMPDVEDIDLSETEEDTGDTEIPDAQPTRENTAPQPTRERTMRNSVQNQLGARPNKPNERKRKLDTPNRHQSQEGKKPRRAMEVMSLNTKIERSETAIEKLRAHIKDGTCPKTLRYNVRANITPDEQFKKEIGSIRKTAEQEFIRTLAKFHRKVTLPKKVIFSLNICTEE